MATETKTETIAEELLRLRRLTKDQDDIIETMQKTSEINMKNRQSMERAYNILQGRCHNQRRELRRLNRKMRDICIGAAAQRNVEFISSRRKGA